MAIINTVATPATLALQAQGFAFQTESTLQLITALLTNEGADSYELAHKRGVPFVRDTPPPTNQLRPWESQLHHRAIIERTKGILAKQEQRGQCPPTDDLSRDFEAQCVAATVIDHVKSSGLCVYVHKLLFSSEYATGMGDKLLAAMYDKDLGTTSSCVAIGAGCLPPLPTRRLKDYLRVFGPKRQLLGMSDHSLSSWVAREKPYVIEFPEPELEAGKTSHLDRFGPSGPYQLAELGMGFILVAQQPHDLGYSVVTPLLFCSPKRPKPSEASWRNECHYNVHRLTSPAGRQLTTLLQMRKRHKIVQLDACTNCHAIYVCEADKKLRPDLPARCACQA